METLTRGGGCCRLRCRPPAQPASAAPPPQSFSPAKAAPRPIAPAARLLRLAPLWLLLLLPLGCTYQIRPPLDPQNPVSVFVADYGYHSTLLLPRGDNGVVEYAYGEREWFAHNHEEWYRVAPVLLWPTPAVLGRRELAAPPTYQALREHVRPQALHEIPVERAAADRLAQELDAEFESRRGEAIVNKRLDMTFVPYGPPYCLFSHCNMFVAEWLRDIGCDVTGLAAIADFRVVHDRP